MDHWNLNDGIIPFITSILMYGLYIFLPPMWEKWKEAQRKLVWWRNYEARISPPDEASRELLQQKTFDPEFNTLGSLGFECLGDYVVLTVSQTSETHSSAPLASPDTAASKQFAFVNLMASRVFVHKGHGCIAFVSILSSRGRHPLLQIASRGEDWFYTSEANTPARGHVGRSPRDLKSHHGSISPSQLLEAHLECRTEIARIGGFDWGAPLTMEEIFIQEEKEAQNVRDFARRNSPLSLLIWEYRDKRQGDGDCLGELTGKVSLPKSPAT